jgi:lipopolysaccharide export system protein LptA
MRGTRALLLLAIAGILAFVGSTYFVQYARKQREEAAAAPKALPLDVNAAAEEWRYAKTENGRPIVEIRAKDFRQIREPSRVELRGVELKLYDKQATSFDRVKSARAEYDMDSGILYSEGDVEINMTEPADGPRQGRLMAIYTSGVTFDSKDGSASTSRFTRFRFDGGEGQATGAAYNPVTRELHLRSDVRVTWNGIKPGMAPTAIEAGELLYKEAESRVLLLSRSRLQRAALVIEGGDSVVTLENGVIRQVVTQNARGNESAPARRLDFQAQQLTADLTPEGQFQAIVADRDARIQSTSPTGATDAKADRVQMDFQTTPTESLLQSALATGNARLQSKPPAATPGRFPTRVLSSQTILIQMRPGGEEIERVETQAPGTLEFIPNAPTQSRRRLEAFRLWFHYGANNHLERFDANKVTTRTDPPASRKSKEPPVPVKTSSQDLRASFDTTTGEMTGIEQSGDFQYEEGARRARADRGMMNSAENRMILHNNARLWDATGSLSAVHISMDRTSGDVVAEGNVVSSRLPDPPDPKKKANAGTMFSSQQPLQATSNRMVTSDRNQRIRYEQEAVLWQGTDRIQAPIIEIDRARGTLSATGGVRTLFADRPDQGAASASEGHASSAAPPEQSQTQAPARAASRPSSSPVLVDVRAGSLHYNDAEGVAHYRDDVRLVRQSTRVNARELRAFFVKTGQQSKLDRAFAQGAVRIHQESEGRSRTGEAENAEYYLADERVVLYGGEPVMVDSQRGTTRGERLTYYAKNEKLQVDSDSSKPVVTRIQRKP